jgi:cardiolipin synthase
MKGATQGPVLPAPWASEQVFLEGDAYFEDVEAAIAGATYSVDVECYIFSDDVLGRRIVRALAQAASRDVHVRIIVDGIGSPRWRQVFAPILQNARVEIRVFHEPELLKLRRGEPLDATVRSIYQLFARLNQRNHRKLFIIDGGTAFMGGMNVWDVHLSSVHGAEAWRDTAVKITGEGLAGLAATFNAHWELCRGRVRSWMAGRLKGQRGVRHPRVLANTTRSERLEHYRTVLKLIDSTHTRLWITTPYFVPPKPLLRALTRAAKRGVDVRLIVPARSDVFFMPWASGPFYVALLKAGARVYQYLPRVLHAKTSLGDQWALVGSSNLNHRSILHDLELDVLLTEEETLATLAAAFEADLRESILLDLQTYARQPWWKRRMSRVVLLFRIFL